MYVVLLWDANTESDLAGYQVFHGLSTGVYTPADTATVLAPTTTYTFTGLALGVRHYFNIKAFDTTGNLSAFGTELSRIEEFPVFTEDFMVRPSVRPWSILQTDRSHMVSGFMADVLGYNVPPPAERIPIGGFMIV